MDSRQALAFIIAYAIVQKRKKKVKKKKCWVRKWVDRRIDLGAGSALVNELRLEDAQQFTNFIRMSAVQFELLLGLIKHQIVKKNTKLRDAIPVHDRLMVTLRFLASDRQLKHLGASLDWPMEVFTMDSAQSHAVTEAFIKLYEKDLIYRSDYLINWSCVLQSAISDIEVEHLEIAGPTYLPVPGYSKPIQFGYLTKFAYKLMNSEKEIIVATTRPETMLGDVAIAVNPQDDRYASLIGSMVWHPIRNEPLPIICDDFVDPMFGTGAVKVTPGHDRADFEVGQRHGLPILQVFDEKGNIDYSMPEFNGIPRFEAREHILSELHRLQLMRGRQEQAMVIPICSRSKDVVELLVKPQWFIKSQEMALNALNAVKEGKLCIDPPHFEKTWFNWLENIRDWCISRQLWWGHQIPMYLCSANDNPDLKCWISAESMNVAKTKAAQQLHTDLNNLSVVQDQDILDTWFSSALLPFSSLGWPQKTTKLSEYYPLSIMETGHDILFFWVARMVMLGKELTGQLPFSKILLHGIVCDAHGRKMSKSLGNVITPEDITSGATLEELMARIQASHTVGLISNDELGRALKGQKKMFPSGIPACGADALRFTLCSHNIKDYFINFTVEECNANRLFCNKIWQATKFTIKWVENVSQLQKLHAIPHERLLTMDRWILSRLSNMVHRVNEGIMNHNFHVATDALKEFLYYDFCDVYLESTKRHLQSSESEAAVGHCRTLFCSLDIGLRALAPFMPYLAQHLHQRLPFDLYFVKKVDYPQFLEWKNDELESEIKMVLDTVTTIRRLKKLFKVTAKHQHEVCIVSKLPVFTDVVGVIEDLTFCDKVSVQSEEKQSDEGTICDTVSSFAMVHLTLPKQLKDALELDIEQLEKKREKFSNQLEKINNLISPESYKINAPLSIQQGHVKRIVFLKEELARIRYMEKFCNK